MRIRPVLLSLFTLAGLLAGQGAHADTEAAFSMPAAGTAGLGLNPARVQIALGCAPWQLACDERSSQPRTRWSVELGSVVLAAPARGLVGNPATATSLSLVGRQALFGSAFSVYGKLGSTIANPDSVGQGLAQTGLGLSFGAGLAYDFGPRLSASVGFDSHGMRLGGQPRELRATNLGLQWRW